MKGFKPSHTQTIAAFVLYAFIVATLVLGGRASYTPGKQAKLGRYQIIAGQACAGPLMELLHGNSQAEVKADDFQRLQAILTSCGGHINPVN